MRALVVPWRPGHVPVGGGGGTRNNRESDLVWESLMAIFCAQEFSRPTRIISIFSAVKFVWVLPSHIKWP